MPFDSNGVFSRVMNWTSDQQNGIAIECGRHDAEDDNFAQGFNDCFCRDGRAAATGDFNLGNNKLKNVADGTAATDAVNKGQMDTALATKATTSSVTSAISTMLATLYPVGAIYIGTQVTCPLASLISGSTWQRIAGDKVLQSSSSNHAANTTVAAGLPNLTGYFCIPDDRSAKVDGNLFSSSNTVNSYNCEDAGGTGRRIDFNASQKNSIYGNSSTVQPPAYVVNVWRRTA